MRKVYKVSHYVTWQNETKADLFTANVLARSAEEAIVKHRKSLEKMTYDWCLDNKVKRKIGVKKVALMGISELYEIEL